MEKIVKIGNMEFKMKSTAANLLKYKAQFGRDLLEDVQRLQEARRADGGWDFSRINLEMVYDMTWLLIKAADSELPPPLDWLDTLDTFPLVDAAGEVLTMYVESMGGKTKNAKAALT